MLAVAVAAMRDGTRAERPEEITTLSLSSKPAVPGSVFCRFR